MRMTQFSHCESHRIPHPDFLLHTMTFRRWMEWLAYYRVRQEMREEDLESKGHQVNAQAIAKRYSSGGSGL